MKYLLFCFSVIFFAGVNAQVGREANEVLKQLFTKVGESKSVSMIIDYEISNPDSKQSIKATYQFSRFLNYELTVADEFQSIITPEYYFKANVASKEVLLLKNKDIESDGLQSLGAGISFQGLLNLGLIVFEEETQLNVGKITLLSNKDQGFSRVIVHYDPILFIPKSYTFLYTNGARVRINFRELKFDTLSKNDFDITPFYQIKGQEVIINPKYSGYHVTKD